MEKLSTLIKIFGYLDYAVSAGALGYGIYAGSWLYGTMGALGLVIAYLRPAERVKALVLKKFMRKTGTVVPAAAYPGELSHVQTQGDLGYGPRRRYARVAYFVGYEVDKPRDRFGVADAYDYTALLLVSSARFQLGIKPTEIVPR
jgi:hypothetical protein